MSQGIAYLSENKTPAKKNIVRTNRSTTEAISSVLLVTSGRFLVRNFSIDPVSTLKNSSVPTLSHPDAYRSRYIDILYANIMPILESLVKPAIFSVLLQLSGSKFDTICPVLVPATAFPERSRIPRRNEPHVHTKI
jgi:hypothetical protein